MDLTFEKGGKMSVTRPRKMYILHILINDENGKTDPP